MSIENRLRAAIRQAVELEQLLETLASDVPKTLRERTERLQNRADDLANDIARLLHHVETWRDSK